MKVRELMQADPVWIAPTMSIYDAADVMQRCDCAFLPIVEDARAIGVVTDRDVAMALGRSGMNPHSTRIREVMSVDPHCVAADATAEEAAATMISANVRRLVVHEGGRLVGVLSVVDLAGTIADQTVASTLQALANQNHPRHVPHETHPVPGQYLG